MLYGMHKDSKIQYFQVKDSENKNINSMKTACMVCSRVLVFNLYERSLTSSYFRLVYYNVRKKLWMRYSGMKSSFTFRINKISIGKNGFFYCGGGSQINSIVLSFEYMRSNALERIFKSNRHFFNRLKCKCVHLIRYAR